MAQLPRPKCKKIQGRKSSLQVKSASYAKACLQEITLHFSQAGMDDASLTLIPA